MGVTVSYRQEPGYLVAEVSGRWRAEDMKQAIGEIYDEATKRGLAYLLFDVRKISEPVTEMTRYRAGADWANIVGSRLITAVLARPEIYNRFATNVASNRGAKGKVFFEEEKAVEWLQQESRKINGDGAPEKNH